MSVADGAPLLILEPLVDTLRVVSVTTLPQLFDAVVSFEILVANRALLGLGLGVFLVAPDLLGYGSYLGGSESPGD